MYEQEPLMPLHLSSRASRLGDLAEALWCAIDDGGLRLPPRRDIARHARVSEATVSRRLRDAAHTEERVAGVLASARERTYPRGWHQEGWSRWVAESEVDLRDVRVWLSCLALATHSPCVATAVLGAWKHEYGAVLGQLTGRVYLAADPGDPEDARDAEILQALLLGLSIRRAIDPDLPAEVAVACLRRVVTALGHSAE